MGRSTDDQYTIECPECCGTPMGRSMVILQGRYLGKTVYGKLAVEALRKAGYDVRVVSANDIKQPPPRSTNWFYERFRKS